MLRVCLPSHSYVKKEKASLFSIRLLFSYIQPFYKIFFLSFLFFYQCTFLEAKQTRILSFDGGGVRGAATLKVLQELQKQTGMKFHEEFDIFAGTSTGSLIAFSLAVGMDIEELLADYQLMSAEVFSRATFLTFFWPEYDPNTLKNYILNNLKKLGYGPDATLGDLSKKVIIPIVALDDTKVGRWRLEICENFTEEGKKKKIVDAILETTAAPTYFPSKDDCVDGGMGMNDPSLAALMTAYTPGASELNNFTIFSVGTGYDLDTVEGNENWGMGQWLTNFTGANRGTMPLVELLMDVQSQVPGQVCAKLLGNSYTKFDFPLTESFALDDYQKIPELLKYTENYIETHSTEWLQIRSWLKEYILQ